MDISRVIQDLLILNRHVSVHGLGSFNLINMPAEVYKYKNEIVPPSVKLLFNENSDESDSSLINTLATEYDLSAEVVKKKIEDWVHEIKNTLDSGSSFYINEIGTFKKADGKIVFESDTSSALFAENFGLEATKLPLIEIEGEVIKETSTLVSTPAPVPVLNKTIPIIPDKPYVPPSRSSFNWKKIGWAALILLVVMFVLFILIDTGVFVGNKGLQFATNDTLSGKMDANELKRKALQYSESHKPAETSESEQNVKRLLKYYLIAGSFKTLTNAEKYKNELSLKGYTPEILPLDDSIYRVSLVSFTDRKKAVEEYIMLNAGEYNNKLWLFSQAIEE